MNSSSVAKQQPGDAKSSGEGSGVDFDLISAGDIVLIRATVLRAEPDPKDNQRLRVETRQSDDDGFWLFNEEVVGHEIVFAKGQRVHMKDCGPEYTGTVLGSHGDLVWLCFDSGQYTTAVRGALERSSAPSPADTASPAAGTDQAREEP